MLISCSRPKCGVARAGHQQPRCRRAPRWRDARTLDRVGVGDVEGQCDRFAAVGTDLVDELLALLDAAGSQRDRETASGEFGRRRQRRCRTTRRRRSRACGRAVVRSAAFTRTSTGHGQVGEPADVARVDSDGVGLVDLVAADSLEQFGQRHPGFHPGQVGAEAEVGAAAETHQLRTDLAADAVVVGVLERPVVAVGRTGQQQQARRLRESWCRRASARRRRCGPGSGWTCHSAASPRSTGGIMEWSSNTGASWSGFL